MAKKENDKKRMVLPRVFTTLFTLLYLGWIFSNSLATAQQSGAASGKVRDAVQKIVDFFFGKGEICVCLTSHEHLLVVKNIVLSFNFN